MNNKKLLLIAGGLLFVVVIIVVVLVLGGGSTQPERVVLEFWGTFDDRNDFNQVIDNYKRINPTVDIVYRQFSFEDYERNLISAMAAGSGPDIWMMHNTWLPKHKNKITPLPSSFRSGEGLTMGLRQFQTEFVDVTVKDLIDGDQIFGLPIYVDTLALYYNKDIFATEGIATPPKTWNEFNDVVQTITKFDNRGNIVRSGGAIGTARNINRSTDILSLLMLQSGVKMVTDDRTKANFATPVQGQNVGEIALQFYTDFTKPEKKVYTWNDDMFFSIDAFFTGQTAMMFNYSHHIGTLKDKSARFNFAIAPMPQIEGTENLNYANYWAPTVSKFSQSSTEAWKFLIYLSSSDGVLPYLLATNRPVARRDLVSQQTTDRDLGIFADQNLSATSWYQADNEAIEAIFADMIDDVNLNRASIRDALFNAQSKITLLMRR